MKKLFAVSLCLISLLAFSAAFAEEHPDTPTTLSGAKLVDADWVKANLSGLKVLDVRKKAEFVEGHLPGSTFLPYQEKSAKDAHFDMSLDAFDTASLTDKNAKLVTYCNGPKCWKSYKAASMLVKQGYKNVFWFRTGFPEWKSKGFPTE